MTTTTVLHLQPHAVCYADNVKLIDWVVISDSGIFVAYTLIAVTLIALMRGKKTPYKAIWYGFVSFIFACGVSHLLHVIAIFTVAALWPEAEELAFTAALSLVVALGLMWMYPQIREYFELLDAHKSLREEKYQDIITTQNLSLELQKGNNLAVDKAMSLHREKGGDAHVHSI